MRGVRLCARLASTDGQYAFLRVGRTWSPDLTGGFVAVVTRKHPG